MTPDGPVRAGEQPGSPIPRQMLRPGRASPSSRMAHGCSEAGALPAGPCRAEVPMHRARLGAAVRAGQAAGGEGTGDEDGIKTKDLCRKQDRGSREPCLKGRVLSAPESS